MDDSQYGPRESAFRILTLIAEPFNFSHNMEQGEFDPPQNEEKADIEQPGPSKELLVMTVEIGDGRQDTIAIHENDDPLQLAKSFAEKHGLEPSLQQSLVSLIQENKEMIRKKEQHPANEGHSMDWMASNSMSPSQHQNDNKSKHPKKPKKGTVYDRIYQQIKKNNASTSVHSDLNKSKSSVNFNYGEYLYLRGLKKKEELKKNAELKSQAFADAELPELTFSPAINKQSSFMSPRAAEHPEDILYRKGKEYQERMEMLKKEQEKETLKECKFKPEINKKSKKQKRSGDICENLHGLHEKIKEKHVKKANEEFKQIPFKPNVKLTKKQGVKESKEEMFDRLDASGKVTEEKLKQLRIMKEMEEMNDGDQRLFHPKTNTSEKRLVTETVWEVLYSHNTAKQKELEKLKNEHNKILQETSQSKKVCENSDKIFHDFRIRQYERLFNTLDSDQDGVISANAIRIDQIDEKALLILASFFEELAASQEEMNFEKFCNKMDILFKTLNVGQRALLLKKEVKKEVQEEERKPFISQNSVALAEKKRSSMPSDMYERLTTANKMTEMRLQKIKEEREKKFEEECTFKPALKSIS